MKKFIGTKLFKDTQNNEFIEHKFILLFILTTISKEYFFGKMLIIMFYSKKLFQFLETFHSEKFIAIRYRIVFERTNK